MKILLVEDEAMAARRLKKMLERLLELLNPEVTWCATAEEAESKLTSNPDLIILDLNLGDFNAFRWVQEGRVPPRKTMIVSADTRPADEAFALGIFAYVFKPVDEDILQGHLERFLKESGLLI